MKVPDYRPAVKVAQAALASGRPVPDVVQDVLGLRFWAKMPKAMRATPSGAPRRGMVRRYVGAIRGHLREQTAAAVILGGAR